MNNSYEAPTNSSCNLKMIKDKNMNENRKLQMGKWIIELT